MKMSTGLINHLMNVIIDDEDEKTITVDELIQILFKNPFSDVKVRTTKPLEFNEESKVPIHPYLIGALIDNAIIDKKGGFMLNLTWLKDLLLQFALDRVSDIAVGLVQLLIQAINDNRTDELLSQIQNPVHRQIARMVLDIIEQTLETVKIPPNNIDKIVLDTGTVVKTT